MKTSIIGLTAVIISVATFQIGSSATKDQVSSKSALDKMLTDGNLVIYESSDSKRVFAYSAITGEGWKLEVGDNDDSTEITLSANLAVVSCPNGIFAFSSQNSRWIKMPADHLGDAKEIRIVNDVAHVEFDEEVWFHSSHVKYWSGVTLDRGYPSHVEISQTGTAENP